MCARDDIEQVVLMWASQTGKTELVNNLVGFFIDHEPSPILVLQPTLEMAKNWSETRLAPMIRDCPTLAGKVADSKARDSGNTKLQKIFLGGSISICGANSPASLASRPIRILLCDEVDRMPESAGTEGDPIALATRRTDTFHNALLVKTSTPTITGASRIWSEWETTDQRMWHVPCPHCFHEFVMLWRHVVWEKDKPETAVIQCPGCDERIYDEQRVDAVLAGRWIATGKPSRRIGYHLNGLNSIFPARRGFSNRLEQAVHGFLEAKRAGKGQLQTWVNTFLAETFDPDDGDELMASYIGLRLEERPEFLPASIDVITAGVDVQEDRLELEAVGHCAPDGTESYGIEYRIFRGDTSLPDVWAKLDQYLMQAAWQREDGPTMRIQACGIDSGFRASAVYNFCRGKSGQRIVPVKGQSGFHVPLMGRGTQTRIGGVKVYAVGVDNAKAIIHQRLRISEPGPGYTHYWHGGGYDQEYFEQLTAEKIAKKFSKGKLTREWKKIRQRNEALDVRAYALCMVDFLQVDWQRLAENNKLKVRKAESRISEQAPTERPEEPQPEAPAAPTAPKPTRKKRMNFRSSYLR